MTKRYRSGGMGSSFLVRVRSGKRQSNFDFDFVVHIPQCVIWFFDLRRSR
jgi:hypothetical protein